MLVNRQNILELKNLSEVNDLVAINTIPKVFKADFDRFFFGKTITKNSNNDLAVYPHDIKQWVRIMFNTYQ